MYNKQCWLGRNTQLHSSHLLNLTSITCKHDAVISLVCKVCEIIGILRKMSTIVYCFQLQVHTELTDNSILGNKIHIILSCPRTGTY